MLKSRFFKDTKESFDAVEIVGRNVAPEKGLSNGAESADRQRTRAYSVTILLEDLHDDIHHVRGKGMHGHPAKLVVRSES